MSQSLHAGGADLYRREKISTTRSGFEGAASERLSGRFGRLFEPESDHPYVQPHEASTPALKALGNKGGPMDETTSTNPSGDSNVPAGYTFLGQFIDHDITLDPASKLDGMDQKAEEFENFRTPNLDLDCVYGDGPDATPFLYDENKHLHIGDVIRESDGHHDLPRFRGRALIGDPRNDENLIVSQLQLGFLKFHNALMNACGNDFEQARRTAIYHYHTMLKEDFLPRIVGQDMVDDIRTNGRLFYFPNGFHGAPRRPYMPIEFAVAAYRYGHSQVRATYTMNEKFADVSLFEKGVGLKAFEPARTHLDWTYMFESSVNRHSFSRKIDTKLPESLMDLKVARVVSDTPISLATRNLLRGLSFNMWSGQSVAKQMQYSGASGVTTIHEADDATQACGLTETPLWYYILQDSQIEADGNHLGPVGGRIVAEVLLGLIDHYWESTRPENWVPSLAIPQIDSNRLQITDILRFAGVMK